MRFKYFYQVTNKKYLMDIKNLLQLCDNEFYPPLSKRISTSQLDLISNSKCADGIEDYFNEIAEQSAIVAVDKGKVIAFLSFKRDYVCEHIAPQYCPNLYVTTVIVSPNHRHRNIAGQMYDFLIKKFPKRHIFTRTWSTNISHIRILISKKFHEHCVLENDRGPNIDTCYFLRAYEKKTLWSSIKQYRLSNNIFFGIILFICVLLFVYLWYFEKRGGLLQELYLAIATSLMASFLCLASDTYIKIREAKNDNYINTLKGYGISNLQFNKNELLEGIIPNCRKEIWISGCRLVMTAKPKFRLALRTACKRSDGLSIKILATPPWTEAYKLIYGEEDVIINYLVVLKDLVYCMDKYDAKLEVAFSKKPLFNDTYKVDNRLVTGPYLHCIDKYSQRITAKDFFSMDITSEESDLYKIFYSDYMTLWDEAYATLDVKAFAEKIEGIEDFTTLSKDEQTKLLKDSCILSH